MEGLCSDDSTVTRDIAILHHSHHPDPETEADLAQGQTGDQEVRDIVRSLLNVSSITPLHMIEIEDMPGVRAVWTPLHALARLLVRKFLNNDRAPDEAVTGTRVTWLNARAHAHVDVFFSELVRHGYTPAWIDTSQVLGADATALAGPFGNLQHAEARFKPAGTLHSLMELAPFRMLEAVAEMPRSSLVRIAVMAHLHKRITQDGTGRYPLHVLLEAPNAWIQGTDDHDEGAVLAGHRRIEAGSAVHECAKSMLRLGADPRARDSRGRDAMAVLIDFARIYLLGESLADIGFAYRTAEFGNSFPYSRDSVIEILHNVGYLLRILVNMGCDLTQRDPDLPAPPRAAVPTTTPVTPVTLAGLGSPVVVTPLGFRQPKGVPPESEEEEAEVREPPLLRRRLGFEAETGKEEMEEEEEEEERAVPVQELMEIAPLASLAQAAVDPYERLINRFMKELIDAKEELAKLGVYHGILQAYQDLVNMVEETIISGTRKRMRPTEARNMWMTQATTNPAKAKATFIQARACAESADIRRARRAESRADAAEEMRRALSELTLSAKPDASGIFSSLPLSFV